MDHLPAVSEIQQMLGNYGYSATAEYAEKVRVYIDLLLRWNRKVALTAVTEPDDVIRFHFGESLFGLALAGMQNGRLADLGSGAGLPGLPIAMARPQLEATLVESNKKKAAFLEEIKRQLNLRNVEVHHGRAEEMASALRFDFVTARALGEHGKWLEWSSRRLDSGGRVVLWLSSEGVAEVRGVGGWKWTIPSRIPGTEGRLVIVGERCSTG